jgi:hypothetical protein
MSSGKQDVPSTRSQAKTFTGFTITIINMLDSKLLFVTSLLACRPTLDQPRPTSNMKHEGDHTHPNATQNVLIAFPIVLQQHARRR